MLLPANQSSERVENAMRHGASVWLDTHDILGSDISARLDVAGLSIAEDEMAVQLSRQMPTSTFPLQLPPLMLLVCGIRIRRW